MVQDVDLTNFRDMTGGDKQLELALFEHFYSAGDHAIQALKDSCSTSNHEQWVEAAHAFKGVSLTIGAHILADACNAAQHNPDATPEVKATLLFQIIRRFAAAKAQLLQEG